LDLWASESREEESREKEPGEEPRAAIIDDERRRGERAGRLTHTHTHSIRHEPALCLASGPHVCPFLKLPPLTRRAGAHTGLRRERPTTSARDQRGARPARGAARRGVSQS